MLEFGGAALYNNSFVLDSACRVQRPRQCKHYITFPTNLPSAAQLPKRLARRLMDLQVHTFDFRMHQQWRSLPMKITAAVFIIIIMILDI